MTSVLTPPSTLDNDVNLGLGGDIALRYRTSKYIDLQLTSGGGLIANNNFDGSGYLLHEQV